MLLTNSKEQTFSSETVAKLDKNLRLLRNPKVNFRDHKTVSVACTEIQISLGP
jgi:hypothetical protein